MQRFYDTYDNAWRQIIVPDKFEFYHNLGPEVQHNSKGDLLKRHDFTVKNTAGQTLKGFVILNQTIPQDQMPCLVYLHSHSGTKTESLQISEFFLDLFNVCSFDFSGYGESEGEYSTLGLKEHVDLKAIVDYLRNTLDIEDIYLWGRSMGAVTSILYARHMNDIEIQGMVLDSPFTDAKTMICDLVSSNSKIPRFMIKGALIPIGNTIKSKTNHDVLANNLMEIVDKVEVPTYIFVAKDDKISRKDRVKQMYDKLGSKVKHFQLIEGEHNSYREDETVINAMNWLIDLVHKRIALKKLMKDTLAQSHTSDGLLPGERTLKEKESGVSPHSSSHTASDNNSTSNDLSPVSPVRPSDIRIATPVKHTTTIATEAIDVTATLLCDDGRDDVEKDITNEVNLKQEEKEQDKEGDKLEVKDGDKKDETQSKQEIKEEIRDQVDIKEKVPIKADQIEKEQSKSPSKEDQSDVENSN